MGAALNKSQTSTTTIQEPKEDGFDMSGFEGQKDAPQESSQFHNVDRYLEKKQKINIFEMYRLYRHRLPYVIEDWLGINMSWYIAN